MPLIRQKSRGTWCLATTAILLMCGRQTAASPTPDEIRRAIHNLGHSEWKVREEAQHFLWNAGAAAMASLRTAANSPDLEIRSRADVILLKLRHGIKPDTPPGRRSLLIRFLDGDQNIRKQVVRELLLKGDYSNAEIVLNEAARTGKPEHIFDFLAFQILEGNLDKSILRFHRLFDSSGLKIDARILSHLYLAKSDLDRALAAAKSAEDEDLVRKIELERGDWKALLRRYPTPTGTQPQSIEHLGFRLTFARLTGDGSFSDALKTVVNWQDYGSRSNAFKKAEVLLLNERPEEALEVLKKSKSYDRAFELLCGLLRFEEAFQLAETALADNDNDTKQLRIEMAKQYDALGKKDKSRSILKSLAE
ncbi:MAG: hypothetical protein QF886_25140, partial [Planctomycetota bacterium]|nr:hypothetical protein [Planctomycetota bacterium]